jgi:VanZ family protein
LRNFSRYQLPLFIWAAIIFWLSSLTTLPHIKIPIIDADKLAHMSVFFVFCWFSRRALFFQTALPILKRWSLVCAFLLTCLYGYFDEVHQLYVQGRTYDYFDMLADAIGALLFVILFTILDRRKDKQARTS